MKRLAIVLACALSAGVLAGCGNSSSIEKKASGESTETRDELVFVNYRDIRNLNPHLIAGSLIQQLYTTIDAIIVGQFLGKSGLAAGASIIISKYFGANKNRELHISIKAAFYFAYAIAEALSGAYCGTGDTVKPMIATLISTCFLRVISIWLIFSRFRSMECIIAIYISSWIASAITFFVMF